MEALVSNPFMNTSWTIIHIIKNWKIHVAGKLQLEIHWNWIKLLFVKDLLLNLELEGKDLMIYKKRQTGKITSSSIDNQFIINLSCRQGNSWALDPKYTTPDGFKWVEFSVLDESIWDLNKDIYATVNRYYTVKEIKNYRDFISG